MDLRERMNEVLRRWQGEDVRQRDPALSLWDIGGPGLFTRHRRQRREAVTASRRELLTALLAWDGSVYLVHPELPADYELPGNWQPAGEATWLVPPDFNPQDPAGQQWLSLGDWRFYCGAGPVQGVWPDVFRCRAAELLSWMSAKSVHVLIESFHDDTDWVVAIGRLDETQP
jgi:hypothetical protein